MHSDFNVQAKCTIHLVNNVELNRVVFLNVCIVVWHMAPCYLTTFVQNKYFEVLFRKSDAYKSKYSFKPLLSPTMVHFT